MLWLLVVFVVLSTIGFVTGPLGAPSYWLRSHLDDPRGYRLAAHAGATGIFVAGAFMCFIYLTGER